MNLVQLGGNLQKVKIWSNNDIICNTKLQALWKSRDLFVFYLFVGKYFLYMTHNHKKRLVLN